MTLEKAKLTELNRQLTDNKPGGVQVEVQFNPESLKLSFANQIVEPKGGDQSAGNAGRQFVGAGTTKLALQLWFDVSALQENPVDDVRRLTQKVAYFMKPQSVGGDPKKLAPPGVRFQWGTFLFDGMVEGLEETLEFFSPEGKPLRANLNLTLSQRKILEVTFGDTPALPGHTPLNAAKQDESLQGMAAKNGIDDWQAIAAANGIEDPLRMPAGQLVDLNAGVSGGASLGASAAALGAAAMSVTGQGPNASLGGPMSGSLSLG
jgi:hypothetical protein